MGKAETGAALAVPASSGLAGRMDKISICGGALFADPPSGPAERPFVAPSLAALPRALRRPSRRRGSGWDRGSGPRRFWEATRARPLPPTSPRVDA